MIMLPFALMLAATAPSGPADAASPAPAEKKKRICVRNDTTGSRLAPPICKTREEWNASKKRARREPKEHGTPDAHPL